MAAGGEQRDSAVVADLHDFAARSHLFEEYWLPQSGVTQESREQERIFLESRRTRYATTGSRSDALLR